MSVIRTTGGSMAVAVLLLLEAVTASAQEASPAMVGSDRVVIEQQGRLEPDVVVTSERFRPSVSFVVGEIAGMHGERTDWCPDIRTSERMLTLQWLYGCVSELRIIRPYAVACGSSGEHPDASELAAAILTTPGLTEVRDHGDLSNVPDVRDAIDLGGREGRVIEIVADRPFEDVSDPDSCRLLPESGSLDPTIEIRGDVNSLLILSDIDGELVLLRISGGGHDVASGRDAADRGYADQPGLELAQTLLATIHDLRFS